MPNFCCKTMKDDLEHICDQHDSRFTCPNAIMSYDEQYNEYGVIIHDGGTSSVLISFCPWCGTRLPESLRDKWFQALEENGFDPLSDNIPPEYKTCEWWK